jgi:EF hand
MKTKKCALTLALGSTFAAALAAAPALAATDNPFFAQSIGKGYMVAQKGMEGSCGGMKGKEGSCAGMKEGQCGAAMMDANKDGKVSRGEFIMHHEGMFEHMDANKDGVLDDAEMARIGGPAGGAKKMEGMCGGMK